MGREQQQQPVDVRGEALSIYAVAAVAVYTSSAALHILIEEAPAARPRSPASASLLCQPVPVYIFNTAPPRVPLPCPLCHGQSARPPAMPSAEHRPRPRPRRIRELHTHRPPRPPEDHLSGSVISQPNQFAAQTRPPSARPPRPIHSPST